MAKKEIPQGNETLVPEKSESKYSVEALRRSCGKLFGVTKAVFDGAVYGKSGKYTVKEMKSIIEKWENKEVK